MSLPCHPLRIAVISDTHNHLPASLYAPLRQADEIWHLGDIGTPAILHELSSFGPPLFAVRGNCDARGLAPESLTLRRCGLSFYLLHEPPYTVPEGTDVALHGHTHIPRDETISGVRYLNPGTTSKPNHGAPPSFAWLQLADDAAPLWKIEMLN